MGFFTAASLALGAVQMGVGLMQANSAAGAAAKGARAQGQAVLANFRAADQEGTRQQGRVNEIAVNKLQDRYRLSEREASTIQNIASERNLSGATAERMAIAEAYSEGLDMSRIEDNRREDIEAIQAHKQKGYLMAQSSLRSIEAKHDAVQDNIRNQALSSVFGFLGSGLQIGMKWHAGQRAVARNTNSRRA
jgi:hypothetical protein